jgi:hypothetical protein
MYMYLHFGSSYLLLGCWAVNSKIFVCLLFLHFSHLQNNRENENGREIQN